MLPGMSKLEKYKANVRAKAADAKNTAGLMVAGFATPAVLGVIDAKAPSVANIGPGLDVIVAGLAGLNALFGKKKTRNVSVVVAAVAAAGKVREQGAAMANKYGGG